MDRRDVLLTLAREAPYVILAHRAEEYAAAWGKTLDTVGVAVHWAHELDPRSVRLTKATDARVVWVPALAARLALSLGLYATLDQAEQTPYRQALRTAKYVTERAVLRLAMNEGKGVTQYLRERHQFDRLALGELRYFHP